MVDLDLGLSDLGFCISLGASANTMAPGLDHSCLGHGLGFMGLDMVSLAS